MTLTYRTAPADYTVLAVHEYRAGVALVTTTEHGGEPWKHFVALDHLIIGEQP